MGLQNISYAALLEQIKTWNKSLVESKVFGSIPVVSDILYGVVNVFSTLIGLLVTLMTGFMELVIFGVWSAVDNLILLPISVEFSNAINQLVNNQLLDAKGVNYVNNILSSFDNFRNIASIFVHARMVLSYVNMLADASTARSQQEFLSHIRPVLIDAATAVRCIYNTPQARNDLYELLHKLGYDNDQVGYMIRASEVILNEGVLQTLYFRGHIDQAYAIEELKKQGYNDERANNLFKTWELIPSVQDILWMVAKEAFEPDQVQRYDLDTEFPQEQIQWLAKSGLSKYWIEKYWIAHWQYPAPGQVLEMLHRGIINEQDVFEYYRVIEMPPYWRNKLMEISYKPFTRVDVRRMHAMKVVTDEELVTAYMNIGYNRSNAERMAKFTVNYNQEGDKELTRAQIESMYTDGIITEDECDEMLRDIGYSPKTVSIMMRRLNVKLQTAYITEAIEAIQQNYQNNNYTHNEAEQRLNMLALPSVRIQALLAKWDLKRIKNDKHPSKEDLSQMLMYGIIKPEEYEQAMYLQGFSFKYIDWYLKLIRYQAYERLTRLEETE